MKNRKPFTALALSVLGMSFLPFLAVCVQYMDATAGPSEDGYLTDYMEYIFHGPLIYPLVVLAVIAICCLGMIIKEWSKGVGDLI